MHRNLFEKFTEAANLYPGPLPQLPLIEISGNRRILVENHCGILQYGNNEIVVKVCFGRIHVNGAHLHLLQMTQERLVIKGSISDIQLVQEERV